MTISSTFKADKEFKRDVVGVFGDAVIDATRDDKGSAGLFTVDRGQLETAAKAVILILKVEDAVARAEVADLDMSQAAEEHLQLVGYGLDARILGIRVILNKQSSIDRLHEKT